MAGETATLELAQTSTDVPENAVAETKVDCINLDNSEGTLKYTNHELSEDYEGNPVIIAYFDYTNKKDETSYSQMTFYPQAFQNGVECDMGILMDENEAYENATKEIQKDTTLNVAFVFSIKDTSPVTLKVTDQSEENLFNNIYQEQELTLQ